MKQIPYLCNDQLEFVEKVKEFRNMLRDMPEYKCILATIYVDSHMKDSVPRLLVMLKETIPGIKILGGTVSANITAGVINTFGISLTFSVFFKSTVEIVPIHWDDEQSSMLGKGFLGYVRNLYQPVAIQMISSGYNLNLAPFMKEVSNIPEDIVVFGGIVDDGTVYGQGFVFSENEFIYRGIMIAVYMGRNLTAHLCSSSGWQPLGRGMRITKLSDNNTTINEIDGGSVREIYDKYLGVGWEKSFLDEAVVFPFSVNRGGTRLNRLPRFFYEDGSANYGAEFRPGEIVRLSYGNPALVIQGTHSIQADMVRFQPEGIFAVSCWARKILLNKDVNQELDVCCRCAPSTGIYALGEFIRDMNGQIYLNNMNLCIIGMREGGANNVDRTFLRDDEPVRFQDQNNTVMSHILHFVQAVSDELELYNAKLSQLAKIDKLTNLLNRAALDSALFSSMELGQKLDYSVSVLLLDLDNFKNINDTYGHVVGDTALQCIADIIRKNVRDTDYAGRWGGDEFMIIMDHTGPEDAARVAERIRTRVESAQLANKEVRLTTSIGVTTMRKDDDRYAIFKRADDALYKAKNEHGKNNVTVLL